MPFWWLSEAEKAKGKRQKEKGKSAGRALVAFAFCLLPFAFWLALLAGCGGSGRPHVPTAEVSGRVLYKGQPLPGGLVMFFATQAEHVNAADIDENGNYKIAGAIGDVKISVDNRNLGARYAEAKKGAGRPPGAAEVRPTGTYKRIPAKYYSPGTSGLTYTVTRGAQTHDIELKD